MLFQLLTAASLLAEPGSAGREPPPVAKPTASGETRDSILMLAAGPLHLRLHVSLGGEALANARQQLAAKLLATLDANQDGRLSREEASKSPLLRTKERTSAKNFLKSIGAGERTVDMRDIEQTIERIGGETVVYRQDATASDPDKQVFDFLDVNKSGVIERDEVSVAAERLLDKDSDRDMCIAFDEFAPPAPDPNDVVARLNQTPKPAATMAEMLRDLRDPFLGRRLVAIYDRDRSRNLTAQEIGWTPEQVARIDTNGDKVLDAAELARILEVPVDLELAVDLAPRAGTVPSVQVLTAGVKRLDNADRPDFAKLRFRDAVLSLSHRHIDPIDRTMQSAMRVFNRLDGDANGYLEMSEVRDSRFERGLFELMDEDADGKVFGDEMKRYVAVRGEPAATTCRVNLYDTGSGFFLALDANGDGRISERERRSMHETLQQLDRDGDGGIAQVEPVRHFHIEFVRGTYVLFGAPEQSTSQLPAFQRRPPVGPAWFQAMDRNNDGDLSWDEFQGSRQDFDFIDADQDALIDVQEAVKAEEQYQRERTRVTIAR